MVELCKLADGHECIDVIACGGPSHPPLEMVDECLDLVRDTLDECCGAHITERFEEHAIASPTLSPESIPAEARTKRLSAIKADQEDGHPTTIIDGERYRCDELLEGCSLGWTANGQSINVDVAKDDVAPRLGSVGVSDRVSGGLAVADVILAAASELPIIHGVCSAARSILDVVRRHRELRADLEVTVLRIVDSLALLEKIRGNLVQIGASAELENRCKRLGIVLRNIDDEISRINSMGLMRRSVAVRDRKLSKLDTRLEYELNALMRHYTVEMDHHR